MAQAPTSLIDAKGNRLYLNAEERAAFLKAASRAEHRLKCLCLVLHYCGCRISEGLELTPRRIDLSAQCLRFRCLKKRQGRIVFRDVPAPPFLIESLDMVFDIRQIQKRGKRAELDAPLWVWSRVHAWRLIKGVMDKAEIPDGPAKTPKGLRHGYGVLGVQKKIPLNMLQKWFGHADMKTTAIYANVLGEEETRLAATMWA